MAFRVNENDVAGIIATDKDIKPYLKTANIIVNNVYSGATDIDDDTLAEVERWLAAHLIESDAPGLTEMSIKDSREKYTGSFGMGLDATRFGQRIKLIDHTGRMAQLDKSPAKTEFFAL